MTAVFSVDPKKTLALVFWLLFMSVVVTAAGPAQAALSPMYGFQGIVAGSFPGVADGTFDQARFGDPAGLLFDAVTERLYVADATAPSIRVVELSRQNQVSTLSKNTNFDLGPVHWKHPLALAWMDPGKTLVVLDPGVPALAVLDVAEGRVLDWWRPLPSDIQAFTALSHGTDVEAGPQWVAVSASQAPQLASFTFVPGSGLAFRRAWTLTGPAGAQPLSGLRVSRQILALAGTGQNCQVVRLDTDQGPLSEAAFQPGAPLPLSVSAAALSVQPDMPAAFVKDGIPFALVSTSPDLAVKLTPQGGGLALWKLPVYDDDDRAIGTQDNALFVRSSAPVYVDMDSPLRQWLMRPVRAAADVATDTWYISDPWNHRILFFRPFQDTNRSYDATNSVGYNTWDYPSVHRDFLRRLVVAGSSRVFYPADTDRRSNSFCSRLEHYLNQETARRGAAKGYEILFVGTNQGFGFGGLGTLGQLRARWDQIIDRYSPDGLVVMLEPTDFCNTGMVYNYSPLDKDGLPSGRFDPEGPSLPSPAQQPPAFARLRKAVEKIAWAPGQARVITVDPRGVVQLLGDPLADAQICIKDPSLRGPLWDLMTPYLVQIQKRAAQAATALKHPFPVTLVYFPSAGAVSHEESYGDQAYTDPEPLGSMLEAECRKLGFRYLDVNAEFRDAAVTTPFLYWKNQHMTRLGQDVLGSEVASRLFDLAGRQGQP